jgi:sulfur carrier protein
VEVIVNGQPRRVASKATIAVLLDQLGLPAKQVAVELNLELVPRDAHAARMLHEGDRLEVVTLVGGG